MTDAFITEREFNGFSKAVNDNFSRIADQLSQMTAKLDTLVNGRILLAHAIGRVKASFFAPPSAKASGYRLFTDPAYSRPFGNAFGFTANCNIPVVSTIAGLFCGCSPSTITGAVISITINPIYRMRW